MIFETNNLLIVYLFIYLAHGVVVQEKPSPKHNTTLHSHQTKKASQYYRQSQQCDLICPGVPPLALPSNFIQNCSSVAKNNSTQNTQTTGKATTLIPSTTTESGGESNETDESTEESDDATTKKTIIAQSKRNGNIRYHKTKNINHPSQVKMKSQSKQHQHQNKKQFRKEKVLLKRAVKRGLERRNKYFNGCYVVCPEGIESGRPGTIGNQAGTNPNDSGSEETDDDPYIAGEDTAIEIIYIPGSSPENQKAVDLYQTNNYAFLEPQPAFDYGFDQSFMERKQKKLKKRKQKSRRKFKENNKRTDKTDH